MRRWLAITLIAFLLSVSYTIADYTEVTDLSLDNKIQSLLELNKKLQSNMENIKTLLFTYHPESKYQIDLRFIDADNPERFSMPDMKPFDTLYRDSENDGVEDTDYLFEKKSAGKQGFNFQISRKSTKEVIFTGDSEMIFSENYLKYSSYIPSNNIFGIGERFNANFKLKNGIYTMNGVDQLWQLDDGKTGGQGVYGSHPVYLIREKSGNYHMVFYKNPTPSDCILEDNKITFKSVGGIIHFKIFLGDKNPETVIRRFHEYLGGGHALPPFWAFGFHQSRWGYRNDRSIYTLIDNHIKHNIPLDTVWSDIDFMKEKQTFTVDNMNFPDSFFNKIHNEYKLNYVPIVDCGVGANGYNEGNLALKKGIDMDIFLRSPYTGQRYKGLVWPGDSFFPDFFNPNCSEYWSFMFKDLYSKTKFTGMWLDMNEPSNFNCRNDRYSDGGRECVWVDRNPNNEVKTEFIRPQMNLPFLPGNQKLEYMTLPPNLVHYGNYTHKDVHNLYGLMDTYLTFNALKDLNKVYPFLLTRSSFTGAGRYTFKWTGDNASRFSYLRTSIPSILHFNIFGIPFIGSDICGFMENTWDELCQRWIQLGALYPFARNHNNDQPRSQEFYSLSEGTLKTAVKNLKLRYALLKHYFMLFVRTNHRGTVFRPVLFEFSDDEQCLEDNVLNNQFLLGNEIMATPVVEEKQNTVNAYFPQGDWFDLLSGYKMKEGPAGQYREVLNTVNDYVPIYLREGKLIGMQDSTNVLKTADLNNEFNLICTLKPAVSSAASGSDSVQCSGNLLNVNDQLDEKEIQENCDQEYDSSSNCILDVTITIHLKKKLLSFDVTSHSDVLWKATEKSKLKLKNITIKSLVLYNFPNIGLVADKEVQIQKADGSFVEKSVSIKKHNYSYNKSIIFDKNQIVLSELDSFTIQL